MDWNLAIEKNREALKRILATLVAMAGGAAFTSPLWGGRREASGGGCVLAITPTRRSDDRRPPDKGEVNFPATLPAISTAPCSACCDRPSPPCGGWSSSPREVWSSRLRDRRRARARRSQLRPSCATALEPAS